MLSHFRGRFGALLALLFLSFSLHAELRVSQVPDKSISQPLNGAELSGTVYIFYQPSQPLSQVKFYLDTAVGGKSFQTENIAPYDFAGTAGGGAGNPFDADSLSAGSHTIAVLVTPQSGSAFEASATFTVGDGGGGTTPTLNFASDSQSFSVTGEQQQTGSVALSLSDGSSATANLSSSASWLTLNSPTQAVPGSVGFQVDSTGLGVGSYSATITASVTGYPSVSHGVSLTVLSSGSSGYSLLVSTQPDRSGAVPLGGQSLSGPVYIFTSPDEGVSKVRFYLDNPSLSGSSTKTEGVAPYDFAGTAPDGTAYPFNVDSLSEGLHTIDVQLVTGDGSQYTQGSFVVGDEVVSLLASPTSISLSGEIDSGILTATAQVTASDGSNLVFSEEHNAAWLSLDLGGDSTPATVTFSVDTNGLSAGSYSDTVTLFSTGVGSTQVTVALTLTDPNGGGGGGGGGTGELCGPVLCSDVKVTLPYVLEFDDSVEGYLDGNGIGTGFTYLQPTSKGSGYLPDNLDVNTSTERLVVTTTKGLQHQSINNLDNALGVGYAGPNHIARISTVLVEPPAGSGKYEQAGLWFGYDEDHFIKLVYNSAGGGPVVEFIYESAGSVLGKFDANVGDLSSDTLTLALVANPETQSISARYSINGGSETNLGSFDIAPEFFSFDAAGIDPVIGTRTFTGIMASHRNGASSLVYQFESFSVESLGAPGSGGGGGGSGGGGSGGGSADWSFSKVSSHPLDFPTAMVWGPDDRLYVTELFGTIHALTFDDQLRVVDDQVITGLTDRHGSRMTLGIEVFHDDPSDPNGFSLWVNHSSASTNNGIINSGEVTRLFGDNFAESEVVISGLPRAKANHGPNSLHFGPDNRLYIAIGGITGAGAAVDPNIANTEFGDRAEQPLSAAILVADVFASGFDGTCDNSPDIFGPNPCDVVTWVTGLRNTYDFVFHSNGEAYATDNGLGVKGAYPPKPTPDCSGFGDPAPYTEGGDNPGTQPDLLLKLETGEYYGHPNPTRDECVFKDGSYQNVAPLPNYQPEIFSLGKNKSANGIVELRSNRACGALNGDLMVTYYSKDDGVTRLQLNADGDQVVLAEKLFADLVDPLPLAARNGDIYVGEFGAGVVSVLALASTPCWDAGADAPAELLDSGSAILNGKLHVVGGKTAAGHVNTHYAYDIGADSWQTLAAKPGTAVENGAVAAYNGALYVFGGSSGPFNGAVTESYRYDPGSNSWQALAPMPVALGGIRAETIGDEIYIAGGMNGSGASVGSLLVYDPGSNSWRTGPSMSQVRDNPGTAVLNGELYVLGGRHRLADGTSLDGQLNTMEIYNPSSNQWRRGPDLLTGRRTFAVGTINGRLQIIGGEYASGVTNNVFPQYEEFDPGSNQWQYLGDALFPTHGAAFGTFGDQLILSTGGPIGGTSFSNDTYRVSGQ
ncbi:PQQ-dependent sugar dehydrogenase [Ferrimonas balearica]|uniref:Kelch repeat-containing protein n=1 Tax=Ferrimonas balearica TaxID=44012 RepID=UPI001C96CCEC|nr:kelch repeat-containing protein [Ferrimonas balearica]MBY6108672.1 PQQ-dependent sugar dehydrogenase [Ferrimonas balearica]